MNPFIDFCLRGHISAARQVNDSREYVKHGKVKKRRSFKKSKKDLTSFFLKNYN